MQALAPVLIGLLVGIFVVGAVCFRRAVGRYKAQIALNAPLLDRCVDCSSRPRKRLVNNADVCFHLRSLAAQRRWLGR